MIKIEQVRLLEQRVQKVIARVGELQEENTILHEELQTYQDRVSDLEARLEGYASSQEEIEAGILSALQRLDEVEDTLGEEGTEARQVEVDLPSDQDASNQPPSNPEPREEAQEESAPTDSADFPSGDDGPSGDNGETPSGEEAPEPLGTPEAGQDHSWGAREEADSTDEPRQEEASFAAESGEDEAAHQPGPELDIF
ncbi:cell division protein ZapB [Alkalispirochaeta alkalica]|uniref:cell division protein ZapB n=1 Tax=Alkalispirochaeta alkalica TaxID=46356 RepID=UPI00035C7763|nr:cell division protein ZapB [Alkalispirochaeta alkalica]